MRSRAASARIERVLVPRSADAPRRQFARLRRAVALAGLLAVGAVAACIDDRGLGPGEGAARVTLSVTLLQAGELTDPNVLAEVFYLRAPDAGPPERQSLGTIERKIAPNTPQVTLSIDITRCLSDPGRLTAPTGGYEGAEVDDPTCDLEIALTLRDGTTALDQATIAVPGVKPGVPSTAPEGVRLVAPGTVEVSPAVVTLGIDQTADVTATVRDRDGNALSGRTVAWSGATAAVTVEPATSVTNSDGIAAATVRGVSEAGPVRIIATAGVRADTSEVTVSLSPGTLVLGPESPLPEVLVGATVEVTATVTAPGGQPAAGRTVTWTTSDPSIGTLTASTSVTDANGVATVGVSGLFVGSVQVGAQSDELSDQTTVKVQPIMTFLDAVNQWAAIGINDAGTVVGSQGFEFFGTIASFGGAYLVQPGGAVERLDPNNDGSAHDVNTVGLVAGSFARGASLFEDTRPIALPDFEQNTSFPNSEALALNDAGDGVGYDGLNDGGSVPVLWPSEGGVTAVSPASDDAFALGVNASRQVVGYSVTFDETSGDEIWEAFMWTPASGPLSLGSLGGLRTSANDVNDAGLVVGGTDIQVANIAEGVLTPYIWRPSTPNGTTGTMTSLGGLNPIAPLGEAMAINEAGMVAGYGINEPGEIHAFLWVPPAGTATSGRVVDLGGGSFSAALDLNNRFQAVGIAIRADDQTYGPVLWTLSAEIVDRRVLTAQEAARQVAAQRRRFGTSGAALGLPAVGARGQSVDPSALAKVAARIRALRSGRPARDGRALDAAALRRIR